MFSINQFELELNKLKLFFIKHILIKFDQIISYVKPPISDNLFIVSSAHLKKLRQESPHFI